MHLAHRPHRHWLAFAVLPVLLALALLLVTGPRDQHAILSPANLSLGAGLAAAAPPIGEARETTPKSPPSTLVPTPGANPPGSGADKGDGGRAPASGDHDLRRAPSIDAPTIRRVLQSYGSPAAGAADAMYELGARYGIDPAYCLAFFIHESTAGTAGVARVTKSVGNIRTTPGYRDYQGYRQYDTWEQGIDDWYRLIHDLYIGEWGLTTVDAIVPVYAPTSDGNNPSGYIATVKKLVNGWRD